MKTLKHVRRGAVGRKALNLAISGALLAPSLLLGGAPRAQAQSQVQRPPQYVLLAFDGSSSIPMWEATRRFARDAEAQGKPLKFTYFISGVYYVGRAVKSQYVEPSRGPGQSAIGWGEDREDLLARYDQTNLAHQEGHEIASHANAHFDGSRWSFEQWKSEFQQFHRIIFDFFNFNRAVVGTGTRGTRLFPNGNIFPESSMTGFRAPLLGFNQDLFRVIKDFNYRYDTSQVNRPNYWPEKNSTGGHWNFPLAGLRIAGTGKRTLSMDFNFYVADSNGRPDPNIAQNKETYKRQMLETYLQYFEGNYNGNRGPIHIGHHFSLWNGGAYWEAMKEFALRVCGLSEVKCVTNKELADFMDSKSASEIQAYREGRFPKGTPIRISAAQPTYDVELAMAVQRASTQNESVGVLNLRDELAVSLRGSSRSRVRDAQLQIRVNGEVVRHNGGNLNLESIRLEHQGKDVEITASLRRQGVEIARATHTLRGAGTPAEALSAVPEEYRAILGDLPEAHVHHEGDPTHGH